MRDPEGREIRHDGRSIAERKPAIELQAVGRDWDWRLLRHGDEETFDFNTASRLRCPVERCPNDLLTNYVRATSSIGEFTDVA